jgi:hypothetical protein
VRQRHATSLGSDKEKEIKKRIEDNKIIK